MKSRLILLIKLKMEVKAWANILLGEKGIRDSSRIVLYDG